MRADYETDYTVRRARIVGWSVIGVIGLGLVLALGWKIAEVSEQRAMNATREHLAASLSSFSAERVAKDQALDEGWTKRNPFVLLRWQQSNYCGELAMAEKPRRGCWYWLPQQGWVLYRTRFGDEWAKDAGELQVYRVRAVPREMSIGSQFMGAAFAMELEEVPRAEITAAGWISH
ncbi:hypothetical protein IB229_11710 [Pseudomonas sp. PDM14]|uniref:hypothetical protein n=1 Tax=Pseudomonas sp. PDM14 TaxID=2769288 RepID=UPI001785D052|nr:hypothetical protein [Pseudomonas sp. PDM14]MBD9483642.1 hypothetical protein [Pseudomonas sp. PDM14]